MLDSNILYTILSGVLGVVVFVILTARDFGPALSLFAAFFAFMVSLVVVPFVVAIVVHAPQAGIIGIFLLMIGLFMLSVLAAWRRKGGA